MTNPTHAPADTLDALLPCPFCGATPHKGPTKMMTGQDGEPFHRYRVWCPHGHAAFEEMSAVLAVTAWNRRASLPAGNEPVAWRYRHVNYVGWTLTETKPVRANLEVQPLYAFPLTPAEGETARADKYESALLEMQMAAGTAFNALPEEQQEGTVGDFLASIHRHCATALQSSPMPDKDAEQVLASRPTPSGEEGDARPANCRNRLRDEDKPYPRSGCASCRDGGLRGCPYEKSASEEKV